jgi:hypothetical protein
VSRSPSAVMGLLTAAMVQMRAAAAPFSLSGMVPTVALRASKYVRSCSMGFQDMEGAALFYSIM